MEDFYSIPVTSEPKYGLGLLASDLDTYQFPALYGDLGSEQLLELDDSQNFYLSIPDAGVFGASEEGISRASSAVTPQSDCSTRTYLSASNISPSSDIVSFQDKPTPQDLEAMIHDTTQSIVSGRQSRAASATWPPANNSQTALNSLSTPPTRSMSHRPQSFSFRTSQTAQHSSSTTPPPPSSFFQSPNLQPQAPPSQSPFLTPNMHSPMVQQMSQLPNQNPFISGPLSPDPSTYLSMPQAQHHFQHAPNPAFQHQLQQQLQHQNLALRQPHPQHFAMQSQPQNQMAASQVPALFSHPQTANSMYQTSINSTSNSVQPTLPNTTGNSSTGYQCFSHGCGGRHFSNWGNLVRHHRERQLRAKAGAKPTCPRCGKGFTRSSARDAHVAGLKCVLGRRRRGAGGSVNASNTTGSTTESTTAKPGAPDGSTNVELSDADIDADADSDGKSRDGMDEGNEQEHGDYDNGSEGSRDDADDDLGQHEGKDEEDEVDLFRGPRGSSSGRSYLAPQQLQFKH